MDYIEASREEMGEVAKIHIKCFENYYLTKLDGGKGSLLTRYYKKYYEENKLFVIAKENNEIVGFAMGYYIPSSAREDFEKENFRLLFFKALGLMLKFDKETWSRIFAKLKRNKKTIRKLEVLNLAVKQPICFQYAFFLNTGEPGFQKDWLKNLKNH